MNFNFEDSYIDAFNIQTISSSESFGALDLLFTDQKYQTSLTYIKIVETFSLKLRAIPSILLFEYVYI